MNLKTQKRKRRGLASPVIVGFSVLYLCIMFLSTFLVREKFAENYDYALSEMVSQLYDAIDEQEADPPDLWDETAKRTWYQSLVNDSLDGNEFMMFSIAIYDQQGHLLAKSIDTIGNTLTPLDEIVSQEDKEALAGYRAESLGSRAQFHPPRYEIQARETDQIYEIFVYEFTWKKEEELEPGDSRINTYVTTPYTDYFGNPDYEKEDALLTWYETGRRQIWKRTVTEPNPDFPPMIDTASTSFPYLGTSYKAWKAWENSSYLHDFPEQLNLSEWGYNASMEADSSWGLKNYTLVRYAPDYKPELGSRRYLEVRMESSPWLAAMDYMKYVYLAGFAIMLAGMIKILYSANKIYNQQEALEEARRDFINAMAHELKTPLGIIRNFTENLQERHREEKRDYYLEQIVGQTEEMDRLIEEMILASKMDSEKLTLQTETLSMESLIREQLSRLEPLIAEKNLQIEIQASQDFSVEGDKNYLSKALWSLLSNAATYNLTDGMIRIFIDALGCRIENTGEPLSAEQLDHAFDLFYSGDKSRSQKGEKHMGMGLYLAKRILERHHLKLTLENGGLGVRVAISRAARR